MAAESATGLIPDELFDRNRRAEVIDFLLAQGWPARQKRDLFFGWAREVHAKLTGAEVTLVEASGIDRMPGK